MRDIVTAAGFVLRGYGQGAPVGFLAIGAAHFILALDGYEPPVWAIYLRGSTVAVAEGYGADTLRAAISRVVGSITEAA